jgi:hypothetical protein
MKKLLASMAALILLAGCAVFKTVPHYTPDPENAEIVRKAIDAPVNVGEFSDASYRKELTCRSLAIVEAPDSWSYADVIRYALIDELAQAQRYDPDAPVTITAQLDRIDFETEKGTWIIRMTLASSNGKTMTIEQRHTWDSPAFGEWACTRAVSRYMSVLTQFMKRLLASPEFAELTKDTPPPPSTSPFESLTTRILETGETEVEAEARAREIGKERVRQTDSLEPARQSPPVMR